MLLFHYLVSGISVKAFKYLGKVSLGMKAVFFNAESTDYIAQCKIS